MWDLVFVWKVVVFKVSQKVKVGVYCRITVQVLYWYCSNNSPDPKIADLSRYDYLIYKILHEIHIIFYIDLLYRDNEQYDIQYF